MHGQYKLSVHATVSQWILVINRSRTIYVYAFLLKRETSNESQVTLQGRESALERGRPRAVRAEVEAELAWMRGGEDAALADEYLVAVEVELGEGGGRGLVGARDGECGAVGAVGAVVCL